MNLKSNPYRFLFDIPHMRCYNARILVRRNTKYDIKPNRRPNGLSHPVGLFLFKQGV